MRRRLCAAVLLVVSGQTQALPQGGEVIAGDASIAVSGGTMDIHQNSQRAILNFQSFDIGGQQTVNFHQPGSDAVALNRVLGGNLSEIHGALNANGQIYLINPSGVLFGNGAQVNVGSLVVSTLAISDQDFLAGRDRFAGATSGTVENRGSINAEGRVVLLAPEVLNRGDITVPGGDITLRSGRQALLHTPGSDIPILLEEGDFPGRVLNEGSLQAANVALVLEGARQAEIYDAAVNNTGLVRAVRASGEGGTIELLAPGGDLVNSGVLDAAATQGSGGNVSIEGARIGQSGVISADGAGAGDGGHIDLYASQAIAMHSGSAISADAGTVGDGGDVVVIAERATWFTEDATISARGGSYAGDGGFVEVSGHEFVSVAGAVDVGADHGEGGLWLIDPTDITITSNLDSNGTFIGSNPSTWTPSGTPTSALINVTTLRNTLNNNGNVLITTASGGAGQGNILFDATLDYNGLSGTRTLTLQANGSIIFNIGRHITDSNPGTVEGLNFNATAGNGFVLPDGASIYAGTGKINITATSGDVTFTGLGSSANAADAIRVTANTGRLINAGESTWDLTSNGANGGVILSGSGGITDISLDANFVDALSSGGNISLFAADAVTVSRLSSANSASIHSEGEVLLRNTTVLGGNNVQISSSLFVAVPQNGLTAPGTLTLLGPDIVDENFGRTLSLGANHLEINTNAAGGNLQINSTANTLSLTNGFTNTITVTDADGLTLATVAPQGGNISISSGAGTDLAIGTDINLAGMAGSLALGAGRNLLLNASILDASGPGVTLNAPNSVIFASGSQVNAGTGNISITASTGNVALGRLTGGALTVTAAGSITDANGAALNLSGTSASLTAGTFIGTLADGLESTLGSLNLTSTSGGAFLSNSQALALSSLNINGNLNISLPTAGNLTLAQSSPTISGNATFSVAAGQLVIPDAGWSIAGNLTVNAQGIRDTNTTVTLGAAAANLTLGGAAGILNVDFDSLVLDVVNGQALQVLDTDGLAVTSVGSNGNLTLSTGGTGNLSLGDIRMADGVTFNFATGGALTQTGQLSSTGGANNVSLNFTSGGAMSINGNLRDVASLANSVNYNFVAGNGFSVQSNATVDAGVGTITVQAQNGNASITGLATANTSNTAVSVSAPNGAILDANATRRDINVPLGGFRLRAMGNVESLEVESNFLDVDSAAGNISLNEETSTSALRLTAAAGTINVTTGNQFTIADAATFAAQDFTLTAGGEFIVPTTGLSVTNALTISASNLRDTDTNVSLSAASANITLTGATAARSWNTSFDQLVLNLTGAGAFALIDSNGLTLTSVTTGGNASFTSTNADLLFTAAPAVAGSLSLTAQGSGDVVIPNSGLLHGGALTVVADNLRDTNTAITLGATSANINLRDGAAAQTWNTSFDSLILAIAGSGDFSLMDTNGITITSAATGGNASYTAAGADLVLAAAPAAGGHLSLNASGSGNVVIPNTGLVHGGNLTVVADNLLDSDHNITLGAADANITLRDGAAARTWTTGFANLALDIAGGGAFSLTDSNNLTITSASTGGSASFSTTNGDLVLAVMPAVGGDLTLATLGSGNLVIPAVGLVHNGNLTVTADNLVDGDSTFTLGATAAAFNLRGGAVAQTWNTSFESLALSVAGSGDFTLTDTNGLTLTSLTTGGNASFSATGADLVLAAAPTVGGDLTLRTLGSGDVVIPDTGLSRTGNLRVVADNLVDSDHNLTLGAARADITLRDGASARTWATSFTELVLAIAGGGAFNLTDINDLTLVSAATGGNASFTTTGADLVVMSSPTVAGTLSLAAAGGGDLVIPDAGLDHSGALTLSADRLRDSDATLSLAATDLRVTLRNQQAATIWNTSLDSLDLTLAGGGTLNLVDSGPLVISGLHTDGLANLSSTGNLAVADLSAIRDVSLTSGGDLTLTGATLGGGLELTTAPGGTLITDASGLVVSGNLSVDAGRLRDSDDNAAARWSAAETTLRLRNTTEATHLDLQSASLSLIHNTAADLELQLADGTRLDALESAGDVSLTSAGGMILGTSDLAVTGLLSLDLGGDLTLDAAGLTFGNELQLAAANLGAAGGGPAILAGQAADLTLTGNQALDLSTRLNQLSMSYAAAGPFTLTSDRNLSLTRFDAPAVSQLSLTVNGLLTLPDTGVAALQRLSLDAVDLRDSDKTLFLTASQVAVRLSNATGDNTWNLNADELDVLMRGSASLTVAAADGLTLADLNNDGQAVSVENGNFALHLSSGDLMVAADLSAADLSADGQRTGLIDLGVGAGSLNVQEGVRLVSSNVLDQGAQGDASTYGIRLRLLDSSAADRTITLAEGAGLRAIGGDILIDTRPAATAGPARRHWIQIPGSQVEAYNNPGDPVTGAVLLNGVATGQKAGETVRAGRTLAIVTDVAGPDFSGVLDQLDDLDGRVPVLDDSDTAGPKAAQQFEQVFGTCDELDQKNRHRCRVDTALKAFLSHWLVGGEMPPKTENPK